MRNSSVNHRNFRGSVVTTYTSTVTNYLQREYGPLKNAAKIVARLAGGASQRTVENWLAGKNAPGGENLIALMASCDGLAQEIIALVESKKRCVDQ